MGTGLETLRGTHSNDSWRERALDPTQFIRAPLERGMLRVGTSFIANPLTRRAYTKQNLKSLGGLVALDQINREVPDYAYRAVSHDDLDTDIQSAPSQMDTAANNIAPVLFGVPKAKGQTWEESLPPNLVQAMVDQRLRNNSEFSDPTTLSGYAEGLCRKPQLYGATKQLWTHL